MVFLQTSCLPPRTKYHQRCASLRGRVAPGEGVSRSPCRRSGRRREDETGSRSVRVMDPIVIRLSSCRAARCGRPVRALDALPAEAGDPAAAALLGARLLSERGGYRVSCVVDRACLDRQRLADGVKERSLDEDDSEHRTADNSPEGSRVGGWGRVTGVRAQP